MPNKVLLTMEVPTNHLDLINPLIDGMFCIATECLKDEAYYAWHREHGAMFLDNGAYEEGAPMNPTLLVSVAVAVNPRFVFAPDILHDAQATIIATADFIRRMHYRNPYQGIGFIPQGKNSEEIVGCIDYWLDHDMIRPGIDCIGLSFLNDRNDVLLALRDSGTADRLSVGGHWVHMLGLYNTSEISDWPPYVTSMDTVKPFKAAYHGYALEDCPRGLGKWNTYMTLENEQAYGTLFRNISLLHTKLTEVPK